MVVWGVSAPLQCNTTMGLIHTELRNLCRTFAASSAPVCTCTSRWIVGSSVLFHTALCLAQQHGSVHWQHCTIRLLVPTSHRAPQHAACFAPLNITIMVAIHSVDYCNCASHDSYPTTVRSSVHLNLVVARPS